MKFRMTKLLVVMTAILGLSACVTPTNAPAPKLNVASFDYTPPTTNASGSAGMKIILVNPSFAEDFAQSGIQPYASFAESMANDFQEILSALGYTVLGPYETFDEVIFTEKETADLVLLADIDISQTQSITTQRKLGLGDILISSGGSEGAYTVSGSLGIGGKLTLKAREPQSAEQMWTKSLEIVSQSVSIQSASAWPPSAIASGVFLEDPGVYNPTADALGVVYADAMGKVNTYLDPRELRQLIPQIRRIKERVRF